MLSDFNTSESSGRLCVQKTSHSSPVKCQLLQISRVGTTLGCCQCKSLDRWPLSFTMWPKQEWPASILHKLDAAKGHSSLRRTAPTETSQGVRTLLLLHGLLQVPDTFFSFIFAWPWLLKPFCRTSLSPFTGPMFVYGWLKSQATANTCLFATVLWH